MTEYSGKAHPATFTNDAPQWRIEKIEHENSDERRKKTELITDSNQQYDSLISKTAKRIPGERNNVRGLKREFTFLEKLKTTGITPFPILLKLSPTEDEAKLLMTKIPGKSFEEIDTSSDLAKSRFSDIVKGVSQAIETINKEGVLIVDINKGTFLLENLENENKPINTSVVDFEIAEETNQLDRSAIHEQLKRWYKTEDIGLVTASKKADFRITEEVAKKLEQFLGAKTVLESFLGEDYSKWEVDMKDLTEADRSSYEKQFTLFKNVIEETALKDLSFLPLVKESDDEVSINDLISWKTNLTMINITLPYLLKMKNIEIEEPILASLQKILSPYIEERPANGITQTTELYDNAKENVPHAA